MEGTWQYLRGIPCSLYDPLTTYHRDVLSMAEFHKYQRATVVPNYSTTPKRSRGKTSKTSLWCEISDFSRSPLLFHNPQTAKCPSSYYRTSLATFPTISITELASPSHRTRVPKSGWGELLNVSRNTLCKTQTFRSGIEAVKSRHQDLCSILHHLHNPK